MAAEKIDIVELARRAGLDPKKVGTNEWVVLCPRHGDRKPSLRLNGKKNVFLCDPCKAEGRADAGGGVKDFRKLFPVLASIEVALPRPRKETQKPKVAPDTISERVNDNETACVRYL